MSTRAHVQPDTPKRARIDVFISSTSIDLPEYREVVRDAILELGLYPSGMETWPVKGLGGVDLCRKMIGEAELFVGVYAYRYGWMPDDKTSITEMEYEWAGERKLPRYCFIMDSDYPWPQSRVEDDADARAKLDAFKRRVMKDLTVGFFKTPDDLKAKVLAALASHAGRVHQQAITPYLRWLHDQSKQSGLLRVLKPRDVNGDSQAVSVEQVYTPLDTRQMVYRSEDGRLLMANPNDQAAEMKRSREELAQSPLTAMEAADLVSRMVLLGDPGSGKSTFLGFLALCHSGILLDPDSDWLERLESQGWTQGIALPVWVTLRDFAQDVPDTENIKGSAAHLFGHIERALERWKLENAYPAIQEAIEQGMALVLLDGLDEVPPSKRGFVREAVSDFIARCNTATRVIITCRILSYAHRDWQIPHCVSHTIAPFDREKIVHFVEAWYTTLQALRDIDAETAEKRVSDLKEGLNHPHLGDLAANPMLLTVMAVVHNHTGTLPRESARLYEECVKLLMLRWRPHDARALIEALDVREDDLYRMLWEIAYDAHDKQSEREGAADIPEGDVVFSARKRLGDLAKAEQFCKYVEERAGLLIGRGENARGERVFTFPHRTFQEYLAGCQLASERFARRVPEHARKGTGWRETLLLATGHLIYNSKDIATPLDAIDKLCPERLRPQNDDDWRVVWLAGEMLLLVGIANAEKDEVGREVLPRLREKLADLIGGGHLPPVERAAAGRVLGWLGDPRSGVGLRPDGLPDIVWCEVPAGKFLMGSDKDKDSLAYDNELPQQEVDLPTFWIAKYPVTNAQYAAFIADKGYERREFWTDAGWRENEKQGWTQPRYSDDPIWNIPNHPVVGVSWYESFAFCQWLNAAYWAHRDAPLPDGWEIRLPTEAEWEKAARGPNGLIYPYGNDFDPNKANVADTEINRTSTVGLFSDGESPYAAADLSGNVWEWCLTKWRESYAEVEDNNPVSSSPRVVRGGSFGYVDSDARAAFRNGFDPVSWYYFRGFRFVVAAPISGL